MELLARTSAKVSDVGGFAEITATTAATTLTRPTVALALSQILRAPRLGRPHQTVGSTATAARHEGCVSRQVPQADAARRDGPQRQD